MAVQAATNPPEEAIHMMTMEFPWSYARGLPCRQDHSMQGLEDQGLQTWSVKGRRENILAAWSIGLCSSSALLLRGEGSHRWYAGECMQMCSVKVYRIRLPARCGTWTITGRPRWDLRASDA